MKRYTRTLTVVLLALLVSIPAAAQTLIQTTTLSSAMTAQTNTMVVASATGFTATTPRYKVFIEHELMEVIAVSGTSITVGRGREGTRGEAHPSAARVFVSAEAAPAIYMKNFDPDAGQACTRGTGQATYLPWINARTGWIWNCLTSGVWNGTNTWIQTYNSISTGTP